MSIKQAFIAYPIVDREAPLSLDEARARAIASGWFAVDNQRKVGIYKLVEIMEIDVKPRITPVE